MYIDDKFVKQYDGLINKLIVKAKIPYEHTHDIKNKVYERILESDNYDESKGAISTWLTYLTRSVISNEVKKLSRSKDALDHAVGLEAANTVIGAEDAGTVQDELDRVFAAVSLSPRDESIFKDFHLENYTAREIGDRYEMETRAVEQVLFRAMQALRRSVRDDV